MSNKPILLSIIELGGYQDLTPLYADEGFDVISTDSVRKAVKLIRQHHPAAIVAEFNYQSDFRDRTSSLETLLSSIEGVAESRVIVLYEQGEEEQYQRFLSFFDVHASIPFPIDEEGLREALRQL